MLSLTRPKYFAIQNIQALPRGSWQIRVQVYEHIWYMLPMSLNLLFCDLLLYRSLPHKEDRVSCGMVSPPEPFSLDPHNPCYEGAAFYLIPHATRSKYLKLLGFSFECIQKCFLFLSCPHSPLYFYLPFSFFLLPFLPPFFPFPKSLYISLALYLNN